MGEILDREDLAKKRFHYDPGDYENVKGKEAAGSDVGKVRGTGLEAVQQIKMKTES